MYTAVFREIYTSGNWQMYTAVFKEGYTSGDNLSVWFIHLLVVVEKIVNQRARWINQKTHKTVYWVEYVFKRKAEKHFPAVSYEQRFIWVLISMKKCLG